jgi:molybdenum cofactor biosynthesis protein B
MSVEEHRHYSPHHLGFAIVTVSDSRSPESDTGGATIRELATAAGHRVLAADLVRDEIHAIRQAVDAMLRVAGVDVLVLTGGTGVSPRDVTVPAVVPLFEHPIEGFGELFRMLSYEQIGAAAMLSRAAAGLIDGRAVFLLPGSPGAVSLAMVKLILPEAGHLLGQARRKS